MKRLLETLFLGWLFVAVLIGVLFDTWLLGVPVEEQMREDREQF